MSNRVHVKKGDTVVLLKGKYEDKFEKGGRKKGEVLEVSPKEGKVIVAGINIVKKHLKPQREGMSGSVVDVEAPIYACKVQLVCPKCGEPTRVGHTFEEKDGRQVKLRTCKKCGKSFK